MESRLRNMQKPVHAILENLVPDIEILYDIWSSYSMDFGYPVDYQGFTSKSAPLLKVLHKFQGRRVVDIGCNSGLYSYLTGCYATKVIGCDVEHILIRRAEDARPFYEARVGTNDVRFHLGNFVDELKDDVTGIMASLVLYHIGNENLLALKEFLTRTRPLVILQTRPMRAEAFRKSPEWGVVSATTLYNGMYLMEDNLEFLRDCGYDSAELFGMTESLFHGEHFPVIVAQPRG
jgi:SAM-dependent methyltransferase